MIHVLINWIIMALVVLTAAYLLPGVIVTTFLTALAVALVLGILNVFIKPLLILLTLPINILTLGLFTLIINAFLVLITAVVVPGFEIRSFWWALAYGIILAFFLFIVESIFKPAIKRSKNYEI